MMQATASAGLITWFWLAIFGGANGLPAAGPPLPLDPQLSVIAPEECLFYLSHAGYGKADPASDHPTEQLYAEPQVERFTAEVAKHFEQVFRRGAGSSPADRVLADVGPMLIRTLASRPSAIYVEELQKGSRSWNVEAALVVNAGDNVGTVRTAISRLLDAVPADAAKIRQETADGSDWQRIELRPDAPVIRIGYYEQYLIVAVGDKTPARLAERSQGSPPQWLVDLRREHQVDREVSVSYLNIPGVVERLRTVLPDPSSWAIAAQLGLGALKEFHTIAGFEEGGCVSYSHLATNGDRQGLLSLLPYKPLSKRDLETIPADALVAVACRLDLDEVLDEALRLASDFRPNVEEEVEAAFQQLEDELGIDVHGDLLHSLGDVWFGYVPAGDLMSAWLGSAAAVQVNDRVRLQDAVRRLVDRARQRSAAGQRGSIVIRESNTGGRTIYWMEVVGQPMPVAPAWCVGDQWLVVGLLPQTVAAVLDRQEEGSLADIEAIEVAFDSAEGPSVIAYQDTPRLVRSLYPWLQMGVQAISSPLRDEGIDIDVTALPSPSVIIKHLRPAVTTFSHRRDGYHGTTHASLTSGGNFLTVAPVMAGLLLPAVTEARQAARTLQELNNLKQIALGILNYESANGHLPTNVYDDQGNALLSWRVQILPYLEEVAVYDQIRMDEPWDSEHNRKVGDRTPPVYQSIVEPTAEGKTRMLALAGEETLWPGNQKIRFRDIRDGTSNTLLVVQASPQSAVDWMKPDDLDFNPRDPFAGLENSRGEFLAVFCDGFVRSLSLRIDKEVMRALATRDGGEVIANQSLEAPAKALPPVEDRIRPPRRR